jgi:adenylate cyclase
MNLIAVFHVILLSGYGSVLCRTALKHNGMGNDPDGANPTQTGIRCYGGKTMFCRFLSGCHRIAVKHLFSDNLEAQEMNESTHTPDGGMTRSPFRLQDWLIEPDVCRVSRGNESAKLEPKVMDLLVYLAERPGQVLSREELEQAIWVGTVVGYDALTSAIIKLRKALGDNSRQPWLIETVAKKGYRLIASVTPVEPAPAGSIANSATPASSRHRLFLSVLVVSVLASLAAVWWMVNRQVSHTPHAPSIVVLPFTNLSGDPKFEYFSDGMTEDIITDLSKLSGLMVVARNSAFAYKDQPLSLKTVADELGVRYVLEGSVRRSGDDLRVNVKLIDAMNGSHLWAERYNRRMKDIFSVQDDVRGNIIKALALSLTDDEKRTVAQRYTQNIKAYDLLLQGQSFYARSSREDNTRARELYSRAIRLDPNFARAHAAVALTYAEESRYGWSDSAKVSMQQAVAFARKAVALDSSIPQTHWALGYVFVLDHQYDEAVSAAERAIALDPNNADAYTTLAFGRVYQGRSKEAVPLVQKAMQLNPHYPTQYLSILGRAYYHIGQFPQAVETLRKAQEMNPERISPLLYLILSYVAMGNLDDASWEAEQLRIHNPGFSLANVEHALPIADSRELARIKNDLRRAGLK